MLGAEFLRHDELPDKTVSPSSSASGEPEDGAVDVVHPEASDLQRQISGPQYQTLLESTKAIPWQIDFQTMCFTYIGPQIESLLGWPRTSWKTVTDWAERIHADDRGKVVDFCVAQSMAGSDHEADYRAMTEKGDTVWIRDVVHVVRDAEGAVASLVGFMFDITERKRTEATLAVLQQQLAGYAFQDGLTGVANRRLLDTTLAREWANAQQLATPLSLILIDVDHFKSYNDHYGHIQGDECLKRIVSLLQGALRPNDFFARFGGEEFVVVLPDTRLEVASDLAEQCRNALLTARMTHEASSMHQVVTASFGVGCVVPLPQMSVAMFIDFVDAQLYSAKKNGRNRVSSARVSQLITSERVQR
jgi:diguanylate cyclase (GGDEF)-like protein/PAS domain S-box-containing protein